MNIESVFGNNEEIPADYTADGKNINPELVIAEIPKDAKTLVLIVDDPDAERVCGFTWIHWVVFDIPVNNGKVVIQENSIPGISGESTYKKREYRGPNPPKGTGTHHYYFRVFALDDFLNLREMSSLGEIRDKMKSHILDKAELIGIYKRRN